MTGVQAHVGVTLGGRLLAVIHCILKALRTHTGVPDYTSALLKKKTPRGRSDHCVMLPYSGRMMEMSVKQIHAHTVLTPDTCPDSTWVVT